MELRDNWGCEDGAASAAFSTWGGGDGSKGAVFGFRRNVWYCSTKALH